MHETERLGQLPVDEASVDDVSSEMWERDLTLRPVRQRIGSDQRARARFDEVLAEINEHQATLAAEPSSA